MNNSRKPKVSRPEAARVFTPRLHDVNEAMYIHRKPIEKELDSHLLGTLHVMLCGESGIGKSWMYKTVCTSKKIRFLIADSANISRFNSFNLEFEQILSRLSPVRQTGYKESKKASVKVPVAEGALETAREYKFLEEDPFKMLLQKMHEREYRLLVIENFERVILTPELLRQLGDILTLLDNPDYAQYKVKILLVGAIADASEYFSKTANQETIANRIKEIPIYFGLPEAGTLEFCKKGFNDMLRANFSDEQMHWLSRRIQYLTLGIPQRIHELCFEIALVLESMDYEMDTLSMDELLLSAEVKWVRGSLIQLHTTIEKRLNAQNPNARRNQVLFALSDVKNDYFRTRDIELCLKKSFPSLRDKSLNVSQILRDLATGDAPILRKSSKKNAYEFSNGALRMVIRAVLKADDGNLSIREVTAGSY